MAPENRRPHQSELDALQAAAHKAAERAYAPYSRFRVGAALRLSNGELVTGVNVENGSYGLTICAERSAISTMVATCGPEIKVQTVCVTNLNAAASPPCGACRQVLSEFVTDDAWILFPGEDGPELHAFRDLLPFTFHLSSKFRPAEK